MVSSSTRGLVVWLTGLSGAGKTTLARGLQEVLRERGRVVHLLDGDEVRRGLSAGLGFSPADRHENVRRVAAAAREKCAHGGVVIVALVSPYAADRRRARESVCTAGSAFVEVYVKTPLALCESRDVKGLYQRARSGELANFTGLSAPYEPPTAPEIVIETAHRSPPECVELILRSLPVT